MLRFTCVCLLLVAASALPAPAKEEVFGPPAPYSYSYDAEGDGAKVSRSESTDGSGVIIGSYTIASEDGLLRVVEYTAGPEGFQANIKTNEPGTKSEASAGVQIEANPIENPEPLARAVSSPAVRAAVAQPNAVRYISLAPQAQPQPISFGGSQQGNSRYVLVPLDSLRSAQ